MEIFETKSKYYKNPNASFASFFSNLAITTTILLIGIVLMVWLIITCIHSGWEHTAVTNVEKALKDYGFVWEGHLKLIDNLDVGSGQERLRLVFQAHHLSNHKLLDGQDCPYAQVIATTQSWGDASFHVENIALSNLPSPAQDIPNWIDYAYEYDKANPTIISEEEKNKALLAATDTTAFMERRHKRDHGDFN